MRNIYLSSWDKLILLLIFLGIVFYINSVISSQKKNVSISSTPSPTTSTVYQTPAPAQAQTQTQPPTQTITPLPTPIPTTYSIPGIRGGGDGGFGGDN